MFLVLVVDQYFCGYSSHLVVAQLALVDFLILSEQFIEFDGEFLLSEGEEGGAENDYV